VWTHYTHRCADSLREPHRYAGPIVTRSPSLRGPHRYAESIVTRSPSLRGPHRYADSIVMRTPIASLFTSLARTTLSSHEINVFSCNTSTFHTPSMLWYDIHAIGSLVLPSGRRGNQSIGGNKYNCDNECNGKNGRNRPGSKRERELISPTGRTYPSGIASPVVLN
jgi:hypothetical protein